MARVSCQAADAPGEPCEAPGCWGTRCGVRFNLFCEAGTWVVDGSALAFEVVCPPDNESVYGIRDITSGACCGAWRPRNELPEPQACELCPALAPEDGDACSLPDDCSSHIDCFYDCCCYGTTTWAQCDGERWHVATDCSGK